MNCVNHPDRPRVAFCQNCGKALCSECARVVGSAVFCEPCLEARLAGGSGPFVSTGGTPPAGSGPTAYDASAGRGAAYTPAGGTVPAPGAPNPGLALLLGVIPGVGAMYNGQYAKGVVHLIIFAVLISLTDQHGIFGMFVAGWIAYQAFEAYHTAKARRDGTPLPNPFGLNDLGERLGFGRAWGATAPMPSTGAAANVGGPGATAPSWPGAPAGSVGAAAAPSYASYDAPEPAASSANPYAAAAGAYPGDTTQAWGPPTGYPYQGAGFNAGLGATGTGWMGRRANRFPVGALVLIGLGLLFLIGNAGWLEGFPIHRLLPFLLIGLGFWIFARRMLDSGDGLADDGTPGYRLRVYRALRGSIWVMLVGLLFLLDSFGVLSWGRSWPLFIIVGGVVAILERAAYTSSAASYPYAAPPRPAEPPVSPVATPTPVTSTETSSHDAGEV